jgi:hypothetical protein
MEIGKGKIPSAYRHYSSVPKTSRYRQPTYGNRQRQSAFPGNSRVSITSLVRVIIANQFRDLYRH